MSIELIQGDCLVEMNKLDNKSFDLIIADLPYGTTSCKWDSVIPLDDYILVGKNKVNKEDYKLYGLLSNMSLYEIMTNWEEKSQLGLWSYYRRLLKDDGVIVLFGQEPFSSKVRMSNIDWYRYDWVWKKEKPSNFQLMNYQCGRIHENIMVFSPKKACYTSNGNSIKFYPIKEKRDKIRKANVKIYGDAESNILNSYKKGLEDNFKEYEYRLPTSILEFNNEVGKVHPTQKPLKLLEYLINTYTLENDNVLDNCMGSGTAGLACKNLNRNFVGIEKEEKYFDIAKERCFG